MIGIALRELKYFFIVELSVVLLLVGLVSVCGLAGLVTVLEEVEVVGFFFECCCCWCVGAAVFERCSFSV
jgi:hypothetical protein